MSAHEPDPVEVPAELFAASERSLIPRVGERVGGYVLERLLGRGGMGAVYVGANDAGMRRAIKVPIFAGQDAPEWRARFEREGRALARLKPHPNVLQVHGAGEDGGYGYCILELVDGEGLDRIVRRGPLPVERALELAEQLARALAHVHAAGIVHRDVKPQNVMVRAADGSAVLMDFGLARDVQDRDRLTRSGALLGTPAYMSPEQADGKRDIDGCTDVYALGAVLYELLAGEPPFTGSSQVEIMKKVLLDDPPPLSRKRPDVPRDIETIVLKAMAKDRDARYASAVTLAEDLGRARRGEPIVARSEELAERAGRRLRRLPPRAWAVLAATLAAGTAGLVVIDHLSAVVKDDERSKRLLGEAKKAHDAVLASAKPYRLARVGLDVPAGEPPFEAEAAAFEMRAADPSLASPPSAQRSIELLRRAVVRARALARAEAALARKDAAAARAAVAPVEDDDERKLVLALAELAAGDAAAARKSLEPLARALRDPRLVAEAEIGAARATLALGDAEGTLRRASELERILRDPALGNYARAVSQLAGDAAEALAADAARRLDGAAVLHALARASERTGPEHVNRIAQKVIRIVLEKDPTGAHEASGAIVLKVAERHPGAALMAGDLAPRLVERSAEQLKKQGVQATLGALAELALAARMKPGISPPEGLHERLKRDIIWLRDDRRDRDILKLWLGSLRAGLSVQLTDDTDIIFKERGGLRKTLREHLKAEDDWAARLLLSQWIHSGPTNDAATVDEQVNDVELGAELAKAVHQDPRVPELARPVARALRGMHLFSVAKGIAARTKKRIDEHPSFAEALRELEGAVADGFGKPDDCLGRIASALVMAGRFEDALPWAEKEVRATDDRHARSTLGREALAEGRPPGHPLEPLDLLQRAPVLSARMMLVEVLILLRRNADAWRIAEEFEKFPVEGARWRQLAWRVRAAEGKTDEAERLLREELKEIDSVKRSLLARDFDALCETLKTVSRSDGARWAFEKARVLRPR